MTSVWGENTCITVIIFGELLYSTTCVSGSHRCRVCECWSINILLNHLFPLSSRLPEKSATSPINPIYSGNEGEAPENNPNVDLFTHLQGSSVGKRVKWRAQYAYTGGGINTVVRGKQTHQAPINPTSNADKQFELHSYSGAAFANIR